LEAVRVGGDQRAHLAVGDIEAFDRASERELDTALRKNARQLIAERTAIGDRIVEGQDATGDAFAAGFERGLVVDTLLGG
jgi:hypothetical protein